MKKALLIIPALLTGACTTGIQNSSNLSDNQKIANLEVEVASLRQDLDDILKPIEDLSIADKSVVAAAQKVSDRRNMEDVFLEKSQVEVKHQAKPSPAPKKSAPIKTKTVKADKNGTEVTGIRIGVHPDKTRLVLDLDGAMKFTHETDASEGIATIHLPNAKSWSAKKSAQLSNSKYIAGYTTVENDDEVVLIVELKNGADIKRTEALRPYKGKPHRISFDFAK